MTSHSLLLAALLGASAPAAAQLISPAEGGDGDGLTAVAAQLNVQHVVVGTFKCVGGAPGTKCGPGKPAIIRTSVPVGQFEVVVHLGNAYVHMNSTVRASFTTFSMSGPVAVGKLNGIPVTSTINRLKTKDDVIVTVDAHGSTREALLTKDDIAAIEALGATRDPATGHFAGREYLRFQLTGPVDHLDVEVFSPKAVIFQLRTLYYF